MKMQTSFATVALLTAWTKPYCRTKPPCRHPSQSTKKKRKEWTKNNAMTQEFNTKCPSIHAEGSKSLLSWSLNDSKSPLMRERWEAMLPHRRELARTAADNASYSSHSFSSFSFVLSAIVIPFSLLIPFPKSMTQYFGRVLSCDGTSRTISIVQQPTINNRLWEIYCEHVRATKFCIFCTFTKAVARPCALWLLWINCESTKSKIAMYNQINGVVVLTILYQRKNDLRP